MAITVQGLLGTLLLVSQLTTSGGTDRGFGDRGFGSSLTSHVLDTSLGRPAANMTINIYRNMVFNGWSFFGYCTTDSQGRCDLVRAQQLSTGRYVMTFNTAEYFRATDRPAFFPIIQVEFVVANRTENYHIPLLLSPYGYSVYRGN